MKRNYSIIYIIVGFVLLLILVLQTYFRLSPPFWDEAYYLKNVDILHQFGFSAEFLDNYRGPAGPTFALVHYVVQSSTNLSAPFVRMVNILFLLAILLISYLSFHKMGNSKLKSLSFAISLLACPTIYTISGLALTELPALFFLLLAIYLIINQYFSSKNNYLLAIMAGFFLGLAILGRQTFLVICLSFIVLFKNNNGFLSFNFKNNKKLLWFLLITTFISFIVVLPVFFEWKNIQPKSQAFTGIGLSINHLLLAYGYAAIFVMLINPSFFSVNELIENKWILITLIVFAFLANVLWLKAEFSPFRSVVGTFLSADFMKIYGIVCGSLLSIISIPFMYFFLFKIVKSNEPLNMFLLFSFFLIISTSVKVTHQFSARYVAQGIPLLVIAINNKRIINNWLPVLLLIIGGAIGIISLESYFN